MIHFTEVYRLLKNKVVFLSILFSLSFVVAFAQKTGTFELVEAVKVHYDEGIDDYVFDSIPMELYSDKPTLEFKDGIFTITDTSKKIIITNDDMKPYEMDNEMHYVWSECLQEDGSTQTIYYIKKSNTRNYMVMILDDETNEGVAYTIKEKVNEADYARKRFPFPFIQ